MRAAIIMRLDGDDLNLSPQPLTAEHGADGDDAGGIGHRKPHHAHGIAAEIRSHFPAQG
jgi:hypothetical protein